VALLEIEQMLLPLEVAVEETLVEFVEDELGTGIHGARTFLETSIVVMMRSGIQGLVFDTRC
jgi:hypothetical protein